MKKLILLLILIVISCEKKQELTAPQTFVGNAIGTTYGIKAFHDVPLELTEDIDAIIDMFNQSMSTWVPGSDINRINDGDSTVVVGKAFKEVFDTAQEIYRKTDGYFDPTVGNLVNAYGFGANGEQTNIPSQKQIDSLLQFVGFYKMDIQKTAIDEGYHVTTIQPGMYLEYNAIAKGTLVDYIARMLDEKGVENYIVEVGGEVITKGKNLEKDAPFLVGINDPKSGAQGTKTLMAINLEDKAMAGSGNYRKYKVDEATGIEYVHTVNPITGLAQPSQVIGVNVIANNCTLADGYATALMAMPLEKSRVLLKNIPEIEVIIMYIDDNGMLRFELTPGFNQFIKPQI
ncbi:FAD:protein FMN transferase [Nonlabens ulvanivorans]|uniref:FAD:protein FMN transferase n=1 Tax=Nonlabens ulvanivorans TaxID=906888 RepID=UPI0037CBFF5A